MKTQELKGRMVSKGIEAAAMAKILRMNPSTFYRKLKNGGMDFSARDLEVMKDVLKLSKEEAIDIFFAS